MWMPRLPVNRLARAGTPVDECLFAVTAEEKNAVRLVSLNGHARRAGLRHEMTLANARAIAPALVTASKEDRKDDAFLAALQRWAERWTPWSASDEKDKLLLNITGCAHLYGGERAMAKEILAALQDLKVDARIGVADTPGAARAAARFGPSSVTLIDAGGTKAALAAYPIEALFLSRDAEFDWKRLGVKRLGDLYRLKSSDIARRCGFAFLRHFEKLIGAAADPVTPTSPVTVFAARMSFPDPIGLADDVAEALRRLAAQVCKRLCEADYGARLLRLTFIRADKQERTADIGLARPTQEAAPIIRQFMMQIDKIDAGAGIDMMRLQAVSTEPFKPVQRSFAEAGGADALDDLVATLGNKLGFDRVLRWTSEASHVPGRRFRFVEAVGAHARPSWTRVRARPLFMTGGEPVLVKRPGRPPKEFEWRRTVYTTARAFGPERIGHEWWRSEAGDAVRDYWRVESAEGARLWLTTEPGERPARWRVAGVFA